MFAKCSLVFAFAVTSVLSDCTTYYGLPCSKDNLATFISTSDCQIKCLEMYPQIPQCKNKCGTYDGRNCLKNQQEVLDNCKCNRKCINVKEIYSYCKPMQDFMCRKPFRCINFICKP